MKRVFLAAFIGVTFFLCALRPASATAEFCPAMLDYQRTGASETLPSREASPSGNGAIPAPLYGFELTALDTRTITNATLAFDTTAGWFTVRVPMVTLAEKDRHYTGPSSTFVRRDYVSPLMYVRFPDAVTIRHAWVYSASASGDGAYGWQAKGVVPCDPPPAPSQKQTAKYSSPYRLDPKDEDPVGMPGTNSVLLPANPVKPLEDDNCGLPFSNATAKDVARPRYPPALRGAVFGRATTAVEVAIGADGTLADAWIWAPSGFRPFDEEALRAAKNTTYSGARSYCRAVPGLYLFRVTFAPN